MNRQEAERVKREINRLCHRGLDPVAFRRQARDLLRVAVPFDASCWLTVDPASLLITGGLFDYPPELVPAFCRNEFFEEDVNKLASLARRASPVGILSLATDGHPERSPRYRDILRPAGLEAELRAAYRANFSTWGASALYRESGSPDFEPAEAAFVTAVSGLLAEGFRRSILATTIATELITRTAPAS